MSQSSLDKCCIFPGRFATFVNPDSPECRKMCNNKVHDDCCLTGCSYESKGIFKDGNYHGDKEYQNYEDILSKETMHVKEERDLWLPVVKASIETCERLSKM